MKSSPQSVTSLDEMAPPSVEEVVTAFGPASLSNLGPGFDTIGLCLDGVGDHVDAWRVDEPGVHLLQGAGRVDVRTPLDPERNTAAVAAAAVLQRAGAPAGVTLRLRKGIALGSGIGSSAASAVAGACAANAVLGDPFSKDELVEAVLEGEKVASGSFHGDNVLPALFGGLVLVSPSQPTAYRRIDIPEGLHVALLQPKIQIFTREAREILPAQVNLYEAVHNAAELAFMVEAFREGDWATVGHHMMRDRLVEPVRATLVPCYEAVREAALEAGAFGCALTGSGPAMFAITGSEDVASDVLEAMTAASLAVEVEASGFTVKVDLHGARIVES